MATDPQSPQVVADRLTEQEAAEMIEYLDGLGIEARPWGTHLAAAYGEGFPREVIQVVVRQADLERARNVLANFQHRKADVNWDEVDVGEPS